MTILDEGENCPFFHGYGKPYYISTHDVLESYEKVKNGAGTHV